MQLPGNRMLEDLSRQMVSYLDKGQSRTYVLIEFIIDKQGKPAYARVLQGGNDVLNNKVGLSAAGRAHHQQAPKWINDVNPTFSQLAF